MTLPQNVTTKYNLGPVQSWVENAAYLIGGMFGIGTIYGWRQSDPFPDHPSGNALDFMTSGDNGQKLADYAVANADNLGVKYVIWNRQSWSRNGGWKPYTSTSNPHTDHVHITFQSAGPWTATAEGAVLAARGATGAASGETCAWKIKLLPVGGDSCIASKTQVRALLGGMLMLFGAITIGTGIILLTAYGLGQTRAASLLPPQIRRFT